MREDASLARKTMAPMSLRVAESAKFDFFEHRSEELRVGEKRPRHWGLDKRRTNRVDANADGPSSTATALVKPSIAHFDAQ